MTDQEQVEVERIQREFIQEVKALSKSLAEIGIQADEVNNHMDYLEGRLNFVERIMVDLKQKSKATELTAPISIILSGQTTLIKAIEFMQVELTNSLGDLYGRVRNLEQLDTAEPVTVPLPVLPRFMNLVDHARGVVKSRHYTGDVGCRLQLSIDLLAKALDGFDGKVEKKEGDRDGKV